MNFYVIRCTGPSSRKYFVATGEKDAPQCPYLVEKGTPSSIQTRVCHWAIDGFGL